MRNYFILRWNFGIRFVYFSDLTFIRTGFADFIYRMSCSLLTMLFDFFWRSNFGWISEDFMISSVLTDEFFTKIGPFNTIFPIGPFPRTLLQLLRWTIRIQKLVPFSFFQRPPHQCCTKERRVQLAVSLFECLALINVALDLHFQIQALLMTHPLKKKVKSMPTVSRYSAKNGSSL